MTSLSSLGSRSTIARRISSSSSSIRARAASISARSSGSSPLSASISSAPSASDLACRHPPPPPASRLGCPPLPREPCRGGELVEEAPGLRVALTVPDHVGVRHLRLHVSEPGLDLLDELLDHGPREVRRRPPCPPCPRGRRCADPRRRAPPRARPPPRRAGRGRARAW